MWFKSVLFIVIAALAGCMFGLAKSDNAAGEQFRSIVANILTPSADAAVRFRDQAFVQPKFETDRPETILGAFVIDGKQDVAFTNCLHDIGAATSDGMQALAARHEHRKTVALVNCLLTHDKHRFCTVSGRQQVVSAMEFYLWSRDYTFNNHSELDRRFQIDRVNNPDLNPMTYDPHYRTWDGPEDSAIVDDLKSLARTGYIDPAVFSLLPRYEIRQAMDGLTPDGEACSMQKT